MPKHVGIHIKAVLFDHDDTLVGTFKPKSALHKHVALKFYNKTLTDEEIGMHRGKPMPELVRVLYGTENTEEAMTNNSSCHEDFPKVLFSA